MRLTVAHDRGVEIYGAAVGYDAHDGLNKRTLTTAIRAYDAEKVVGVYIEVYMLQSTHRVVRDTKVADGD